MWQPFEGQDLPTDWSLNVHLSLDRCDNLINKEVTCDHEEDTQGIVSSFDLNYYYILIIN